MKNIHKKKPFTVIIYGPTGVGKSDMALALAQQIPAEIINMDVGQFYTPLSIGTAKPAWQSDPIPHHLFDILDTPQSITVVEYRSLLLKKINEIKERGKLPIVVGGSGFYLQSVLFPLKGYTEPDLSSPETLEYSWDALNAIDPERAQAIAPSDTYRIARALEIWKKSGNKPTTYTPEYSPLSDFLLIYIERDIQELNDRINQRVIDMIHNEWIAETESLIGTDWQSFISHKKIIGYNEILSYLLNSKKDPMDLNAMITLIQNKTRQYAKRQRTFWRKLKRDIAAASSNGGEYIGCVDVINLTNADIHLYINELLKQLLLRWQR